MDNKDINKIKSTIHEKVEKLNDETLLQLVEEAVTAYGTSPSKDILDELTPEQQQRLQDSIQQTETGQIIPNEEVKKIAKQWLSK